MPAPAASCGAAGWHCHPLPPSCSSAAPHRGTIQPQGSLECWLGPAPWQKGSRGPGLEGGPRACLTATAMVARDHDIIASHLDCHSGCSAAAHSLEVQLCHWQVASRQHSPTRPPPGRSLPACPLLRRAPDSVSNFRVSASALSALPGPYLAPKGLSLLDRPWACMGVPGQTVADNASDCHVQTQSQTQTQSQGR